MSHPFDCARQFASRFALIAALVPVSVTAAPYTFDLIATNVGTDFLFFPDPPTISNNGIVAFRATVDGGQGIFTGTGGQPKTIADSTGPFRTFTGNPAVNTSGTVAFRAQLDTLNTGIFFGNGGAVTPVASDIGGALFSFSAPTINDQGAIAFIAQAPGSQGNQIYLSQGGSLTKLYDTSSQFNSFTGTPYINNQGNVVFLAALDTGGSGIFIGNGGTPIKVADTSGPFSGFGPNPTLNDAGVAAFRTLFDNGVDALYTGNGIQLTEIVSTSSDPLFLSFADPSIDLQGQIAFAAQSLCGGAEVVAGTDAIADRVVNTNGQLCSATELFGDTVTGVHWLHGSNNTGQLAGVADLAHGGRVVWRASPPGIGGGGDGGNTVPEPGTLALVALALVAHKFARKRSQPRSCREYISLGK